MPNENENGVKSFSIHETEEMIQFFDQYGFVVVDNILDSQECDRSMDEVWDYIEQRARCTGKAINRDNPNTWVDSNWPKEICKNGGFIGKFPYWKRMASLNDTLVNVQPQAWKNRENPKVYKVFSQLMRQPNLWVSIDRYGIMRPSKRSNIEPTVKWQTKSNWLHWDLSPFHYGTSAAGYAPNKRQAKQQLSSEYGSIRVQGLIALTDCPEDVGGFHCVPEFVNETFFKWAKENKDSYGELDAIKRRNFIEVPEDDPMRARVRRVPIKRGSLLVWNSQLPHGNFPNESHNFRMVQYIKMIPIHDAREFLPAIPETKFSTAEWFPENFRPSDLGEKLLGIASWD